VSPLSPKRLQRYRPTPNALLRPAGLSVVLWKKQKAEKEIMETSFIRFLLRSVIRELG